MKDIIIEKIYTELPCLALQQDIFGFEETKQLPGSDNPFPHP